MSKIVKGVFKAGKKIIKGVGKVFKKIASSPLGKIALMAAAIYTGGVAFGAWGSTGPLSGIFNAFGTAAPAVGAAAPTGMLTASTSAPAVAAAAPTGMLTSVPMAAEIAAQGAAGAPGFLASIGKTITGAGKGALAFAKENPLVSATLLHGVGAALSPDEEDIMREQERIRRERFSSLIGTSKLDLGEIYGRGRSSDSSSVPFHQRLKR